MLGVSAKALTGGSDITRPELSLKFVASIVILLVILLAAKPVAEWIMSKVSNTVAPVTQTVTSIID